MNSVDRLRKSLEILQDVNIEGVGNTRQNIILRKIEKELAVAIVSIEVDKKYSENKCETYTGDIMNYIGEIRELIGMKEKSVKVVVADYKNEEYSICFHKGEDIAEKVIKTANRIGDGNCVRSIKYC